LTIENQKLTELLGNESFIRWIKGTANSTENQHWKAWEKSDLVHRELREHAEIFFQMKLELDPADDLNKQLNSLNHRIFETKHDKRSTFFQKFHLKNISGRFRLSIAASMVIFLSILGFLSFYVNSTTNGQNSKQQFEIAETAPGETSSLTFSDGSLIRLNENSSLRYRLYEFGSSRVEVWLQGEGFFDIVSNPDGNSREFIVHTDDGKVNVLGTRFSVNTRFQKTSVVLEEGQVGVFGNMTDDPESAEIILQPGQRAVIDKSLPNITVKDVDAELFSGWIDGKIEFDNTSLQNVFTFIESAYNVKIEAESSALLDSEISGVIQSPDLENLLSAIKNILDLNIYQVNDNEVFISSR
jgi:ferric-dicitrate binding protein FerR (iron transport regulator)